MHEQKQPQVAARRLLCRERERDTETERRRIVYDPVELRELKKEIKKNTKERESQS